MHKQEFPKPEVWLEHRVSYGETDGMGVVYYANYLHFFERARNAFLHKLGLSYVEIEEQGFFLPVREAGCKYLRPARFDDLLLIRAGISRFKRASLVFVYEVWDGKRENLLATGFTEHACVNKKAKPIGLPSWLKEKIFNQC
ncbi:MAG: acyl-CoA thioester hydrolase [Desulfonauticus sp.]|jgi:acyl-CoA thioester hydrolase|nr:acyl-CoA thioester hydrolase [Desulfonauticus sp.]